MQHASNETRPYAPSYVDKWMDWVEQLPVPYGLTYLALFILTSVINHIASWLDGWLPVYTFNSMMIIFPLWFWGALGIMTYLNSISAEALRNFRPLLNIPDETMRLLEYEFANMPSLAILISGGFWGLCYLALTYVSYETFFVAFNVGLFFSVFITLEGLFAFSTSAIYYHTIRQLRLVDRTVKLVKHFDLFSLDPVYAFSVVTSRTAICWIILLSSTILLFPLQIASVPLLVIVIVQVVLAISAFVLPLRIVNQRLVAEKRKLLAEYNQRLASTLTRLHHRLEENELTGMAELNSAVSALNLEGKILENISTWPWRSGTFTGFVSALGLPIVIYIIQLVITKWVR